MEIRFSFDENVINGMQQRTNAESATEVTREALSLFNWASRETAMGRQIQSMDQSGNYYGVWGSELLDRARERRGE